ncbi:MULTISPECIES: hypothetical protein [Ramlibacter]|uniref:Uncharacterized protein n=1 Tax=Ramlibacter aquaticus TaxID=2780094 RepID=A0ABR9SES6_9BURK|nr:MULTISPECIES: hypothetical protein [Ramlibacter]MBE7940384.1 hypothetical protein [Ramlibacter aquaticus]
MSSKQKLEPTGERAEATEAMASTPISGKTHEYRADGDHDPRPDSASSGRASGKSSTDRSPEAQGAPQDGVEAERHISEGIPGAGRSPA